MTLQETIPWLKEYIDPVNAQLVELIPSGPGTSQMEVAAAEALSFGGKRVRAALSLLWCEIYGGDSSSAIPIAVAYELAHASALVQDDIIDSSDMRRGRPSIVAKYGLSTAILSSDLLLFNVPRMVAKYAGLGSARLARIFDLVGEACRATTWGEYLDLELARGAGGTEREYEEMIRLKTSTLLSAPCESGALVGGATDKEASLAGRFGAAIGMAYQIQDDALDLTGDELSLGKPVFTDLRGGKRSAVLMHCLSHCTEDDREFVSGLMNRSGAYTPAEVSRMKKLIEDMGSVEYAKERVLAYTSEAKESLDSVPEGRAKALLAELTDYLSVRYY